MILGLTGAIGCGKSTVIELFKKFNWQIFDADHCCHQLLANPETGIGDFIRKRWGNELYDHQGQLNRHALATKVFACPDELAILTEVLYPALDQELDRHIAQVRQQKNNAVYEIPLLFEKGYEQRFEAVLAVWTPRNLRHQRLQEQRGFAPAEIAERENQQLSAEEKLTRADYVLINNGSRQELTKQIERLIAAF